MAGDKMNVFDDNFQKNYINIEVFSNEILSIILSWLPIADRFRCERVNRRWQAVARNLSWNRMKVLDLNILTWGLKLDKYYEVKSLDQSVLQFVLTRCAKYLEYIKFSSQKNHWSCPCQIISIYCCNLKSIHIYQPFTSNGIKSLINKFTNLTKICIIHETSSIQKRFNWELHYGALFEAN